MADLTVHFACVTRAGTGASACGMVVTDPRTARPIHEAGLYLGDCASAQDAAFAGLLRVLEAIKSLGPDNVELRCANEWLVRQLTGASPIDQTGQMELYEQIIGHLLKLDSWSIGLVDAADNRPAADLAERAVTDAAGVTDLDAEQARRRHHEQHTGVPQWTVELLDEPGADCPAGCPPRRRYAFGPDTPAGFCVHAALVALTDGPLTWTDPKQRRMTTLCPHCDAALQITVVRDDLPDAP